MFCWIFVLQTLLLVKHFHCSIWQQINALFGLREIFRNCLLDVLYCILRLLQSQISMDLQASFFGFSNTILGIDVFDKYLPQIEKAQKTPKNTKKIPIFAMF